MRLLSHILLLLCCVYGLSGYAQTASLEVLSDPTLKQPFYISINGIRQNESPAENILIKGLPFEAYGVELQLVTDPVPVKKVVFLRVGKTTNYVLSPGIGNFRLTEGQGAEKPYNNKTLIVNYKFSTDTVNFTEAIAEQFSDFAAPPINFDDEGDTPEKATPAQKQLTATVKPDQAKLKFDADSMFRTLKENMDKEYQAANDRPCIGSVTSETIKNLKLTMKDQKNLRDRYNTATKGIGDQCVTVGQLKDLMRLMDGDELKIEFYKRIYKNVSDLARRSDLFELFYFEASIDEIQNLQ